MTADWHMRRAALELREQLPDGFQRPEYLHKHGMVDMVVPREELRGKLATLLGYLNPAKAA